MQPASEAALVAIRVSAKSAIGTMYTANDTKIPTVYAATEPEPSSRSDTDGTD